MSDKIVIEFDREELRNGCKNIQKYSHNCLDCKKEDENLIDCVIHNNLICYKYKIKEQNNEIKPKFKIGDKVWIIKSKSIENLGCYGEKCGNGIYFPKYIDEYYVGENREIKKIEIKCYSNKDIDIIYYFNNFRIFDYEFEEYCFATKEEAQKGCDKRNKGIKQ